MSNFFLTPRTFNQGHFTLKLNKTTFGLLKAKIISSISIFARRPVPLVPEHEAIESLASLTLRLGLEPRPPATICSLLKPLPSNFAGGASSPEFIAAQKNYFTTFINEVTADNEYIKASQNRNFEKLEADERGRKYIESLADIQTARATEIAAEFHQQEVDTLRTELIIKARKIMARKKRFQDYQDRQNRDATAKIEELDAYEKNARSLFGENKDKMLRPKKRSEPQDTCIKKLDPDPSLLEDTEAPVKDLSPQDCVDRYWQKSSEYHFSLNQKAEAAAQLAQLEKLAVILIIAGLGLRLTLAFVKFLK